MHIWGKSSLDDLQEGMNRLFEQVWHSGLRTPPFDGQDWAPPMAVIDKPDRFVIEVELSGITLEDVEVTASQTSVTIKGQKTDTSGGDAGDTKLMCERRYGSFQRIVRTPEDIDSSRLSAKLTHGVLIVEAPKQDVQVEPSIKVEIKE